MEFLFDNPFMVLVLLALFSFSSVFKKSAEKQKKSSNRPVEKKYSMPSSPFDEVKEIFKEVSRTFQEEPQKPTESKLDEMYQKKKMEVSQLQEQTERKKAKVVKDNFSKSIQPSNKELKITETKLIESVIWSEILGPPRSKKPYYRSRK